ncbi:MAG: arginine decarboxylase, pyruvoyl-dependent [Patescibacteria group bacterium]
MANPLVPKYAFFVSGTGRHTDRLHAFEKALLSAGPIAHNLVTVSSILPASCEIVSPDKGFSMLTLGQITFCVMARQDTDRKGEYASAAVGTVIARSKEQIGYISEYHGDATGPNAAKEIAQRLATEMYETKFNASIQDLDVERITASAASIQNPGGIWVSAVALCIFVL